MKTKKMNVEQLISSGARIVVSNNEYNKLIFSNINRPINKTLANCLVNSVMSYGVLRLVIVVKCVITGNYIVVDGQHLTVALKQLNRKIECVMVDCESEAEMTQLMIALNSCAKKWSLNDYIHGWAETGKRSYKILNQKATNSKIQLSVLAMAYSNAKRSLATSQLKEGTFEITNKDLGDKLIKQVEDCHQFTPSTRQFNEMLVQLMSTTVNYNHKYFLDRLKNVSKHISFKHSEGQIFKQLTDVYQDKV